MSSPTPLTSFRDTKKAYPFDVSSLALDANVHAFAGGIACTNTATGYGVTGQTLTTLFARGIFTADVDNTGGAAGAMTAPVSKGVFWLDNDTTSPCRRVDIDGLCYVIDDHTVSRDTLGSTRSIAGIIRDVGTLGVLVELGAPFDAALASEVSSRQAITTNLASTSGGLGASLVGIQNSPAGQITATNVQTALMELLDGRRLAKTAGTGVGLIPITLAIAVADGSTVLDALTLDATFGGIKVTDAWFIKNTNSGSGTDAVQLCTDSGGSTPVSSSLALSSATSGSVVRTTTITTANATFAAGAHMYVKRAHTTDCGGTLMVTGYRA
jgi:hypothetical protein